LLMDNSFSHNHPNEQTPLHLNPHNITVMSSVSATKNGSQAIAGAMKALQ
jgi:hypothetical protein